ncbi:FF domain-containing protein [Botrytis cinerea]
MLGQSGSSPLDLFWDVVEEEERALRSTRMMFWMFLMINGLNLHQEHPNIISCATQCAFLFLDYIPEQVQRRRSRLTQHINVPVIIFN